MDKVKHPTKEELERFNADCNIPPGTCHFDAESAIRNHIIQPMFDEDEWTK